MTKRIKIRTVHQVIATLILLVIEFVTMIPTVATLGLFIAIMVALDITFDSTYVKMKYDE